MNIKQLASFLFSLLLLQGLLVAQADAGAKPEVIFETSLGSFTLELYPDKAPETVANFLDYVDDGFYTNTIFHRVIPDFVIQGGGFETGMEYKSPGTPVINESSNRLKNLRGTISMARRTHPDTATSQFYINLSHNDSLDYISRTQPGYTVFGSISKGMDVIDRISVVETTAVGRSKDVPKDDVVLLSVRRKDLTASVKGDRNAEPFEQPADATEKKQDSFVAGEHYVVLDKPVATRDSNRIEVVEMFSYGCPHCYEFESLVKEWGREQASDVDFWYFPAVWNKPMSLYAQAFYAAYELGVAERIHIPLFRAIAIEQRSIRNEDDLAEFFAEYGVGKAAFFEAFNLASVADRVGQAKARVHSYRPAGVPEIIVNGKYRIDRMRAGGLAEMVAVADFLIKKERATLKK